MPRLRLGEYLALSWLAAAGILALLAGRWQGTLQSEVERGYFPFLQIFLLIVSVSLLRLLFLAVSKLVATWSLISGRPIAGPVAADVALGFAEERHLLGQIGSFVRDCLPLYVILFAYPTSDLLIDGIQGSRLVDDWLIGADVLLFRGHATVWAQRFISPLVTEVLSLCYFLHVIITPLILLCIGLMKRRALFVEAIDGFILISLLGVSLYVLFPAIGPYTTLAHLYDRNLGTGAIQQINHAVIEATRVPRDAFPSLHIGISALMLAYAFRASRWLALVLSPFVVGNWLATIYLRYHYTVDVLAGFLLAGFVYVVAQRWTARFARASPEPDPNP